MKEPILTRSLLYEQLRDGSLRMLDFALVGTSLGAMLEPRSLIRPGGAIVNEDPYDTSFTDIKFVDGTQIAALQLQSEQWPKTFNML